MNIVFCVNRLGLVGLGATVTSLVRNCSDSKRIKLWFLCSGLFASDKANVQQLLDNELFNGSTGFIDLDIKKVFGHLAPLHQDWTAYGRLLIPDLIKDKFALYLDSDLIIEVDILQLATIESDKVVSAVHEGPVRLALDNYVFINKLKWNPATPYFNSGVLLLNIEQWINHEIGSSLQKVSNTYSEHLTSHDQTILNILCDGDFNHLPAEFNVSWPPNKIDPAYYPKCIIHFIGAPKPWDLCGKVVHNGYAVWRKYNTNFWHKAYGKFDMQKLARTWHIRKSIAKNLGSKLFVKQI